MTRALAAGWPRRATGCSTSAAPRSTRAAGSRGSTTTARPSSTVPVELWITCRMTHVYALGHLLGRPDCAALVDHGVAALRGRFRDGVNGGWWAQVGPDGPTVTDKTAYEHAFVVLAAASATAADRPGARELLDEALTVLLDHFWDDEFGMVVEQWDESWTTLDAYRGVNANMHTVEALLSAADVLDDASLRDRALRITDARGARAGAVRTTGGSRSTSTPRGHRCSSTTSTSPPTRSAPTAPPSATGSSGLASRCTCAPASAQPRPTGCSPTPSRCSTPRSARAGRSTAPTASSTPSTGPAAPSYASGCTGSSPRPPPPPPPCTQATGDSSYADWYRTWWQHIDDHFRDPVHGSWHHELAPDLTPSSRHLAGQARHLPRLPGHPPPTPPARPDARPGAGRRGFGSLTRCFVGPTSRIDRVWSAGVQFSIGVVGRPLWLRQLGRGAVWCRRASSVVEE